MDVRSRDRKQTALRALMKNESLSKLIKEAVESPLGSTARKRAQKVMGIMKKTSGRMDGAGGPGFPVQNMRTMPRHLDYSNFVIFPATPKQRIPFGGKAEFSLKFNTTPTPNKEVMDGAGGPGSLLGGFSGFGAGSTLNQSPLAQSPFGQGLLSQSTPATPSSGGGLWDSVVSGAKRLLTPFGGQTQATKLAAANKAQGSYEDYLKQNMNNQTAASTTQSGYFAANPIPGVTVPGQAPSNSPLSSPGGANSANIDWSAYRDVTGQIGQVGGGGAQQGGGQVGGGQQGGGGYQAPQQQAPGIGSMYPGIQGAVDSGMGPTMFAMQALAQGPDYLKKLPGFANMPDSVLGSGSLGDRLEALEVSMNDKYHLDEQRNQLLQLVNQGVGLGGRLTDYIRGRDQFLNETNDMLETFKDKYITMGTADPETQASAQMHMNYLYELKGRQNKRYIEFLNTAKDEYNTQLTQMTNLYGTALEGYQKELTRKEAITQQEYQLMFGALTDMYNTVSNAPMQALEMEKLQLEMAAARADIAKTAWEMSKSNPNNINSPKSTINASLGIMKNLGYIIDTPGGSVLNPNISISDSQELSAYGVPDTDFYQIMTSLGRNSLTIPGEGGALPGVTDILKTAGSVLSNYDMMRQAGGNSAFADIAATNMRNAATSALFMNGALKTSSVPAVRSAVDWLSSGNYNGWWPGSGDVTREAFVDKFGSTFDAANLDRQFLDTIWTQYNADSYKKNPKAFADTFYTVKAPDGSRAPATDNDILKKLAAGVTSGLGYLSVQ